MKKLSLFLALSLLTMQGWGSIQTPKDDRGNTVPTVDLAGALPCNIDSSTGTAAVICGSSNTPTIVYGVIASSIVALNLLVFRDTNTPNLISSTATIVFGTGTGANASGPGTTQFFKFPVPLRFTNGLVINSESSPASGGAAMWTVLYRNLNSTDGR